MLLHEGNIREMIDQSISKNIGLHLVAVEFQRDVLENNFQIEKNFGCTTLSLIPEKYPGDTELLDAAKAFMLACLRSFVDTLKLRSKLYKKDVIPGPSPNTPMTRQAILEFFEGCNAYSKSHPLNYPWNFNYLVSF